MRFGFSQITGVSWDLEDDDGGAQMETDDIALTDGSPSTVTRFTWRQDAGPYVALQGEFGAVRRVGIVGLLGTNLPVGAALEVRGRRPVDSGYTYELGGNTLTLTAQQLIDGSVAAWWPLPLDLDPITGIELRLINDVDGSPWADADTVVDIGQVVLMPAVEIDHERGWRLVDVDPSIITRTIGAQVDTTPRRTYRRLLIALVPAYIDQVRRSGLNGTDLQRIEQALNGAARCVAIPRWGGIEDIDIDELHRTAVYGVAAQRSGIAQIAGDWYATQFEIDEVPPK